MAIYIYTGKGGGKTTAALGLALRSLGHNRKVILIQFLKGRKEIGEYKIQSKLKKFKVYQFGRKEFINLKNPTGKDRLLAAKGLQFIKKAIKQKPKLLILDELNLVLAFRILDIRDVLSVLKKIPKSVDVVLTGRHAPKDLIKIADYANEMRLIKMPKKFFAKKGIQY